MRPIKTNSMIYRFFLSIILLNIPIILLAQVGVNTQEPKGIFHIKTLSQENANLDGIVFSEDGNLGIGTSTPSQKLDVKGSINLAKSSTETKDINKYILTSNANGIGSLNYNSIAWQNQVSSFNLEMSVKTLFGTETRFTLAAENPVIRNELNLGYVNPSYFALNNIPNGYYAIIFNAELVNACSIATFTLSTSSSTIPLNSTTSEGSLTLVGKKASGTWFVRTDKSSIIYIVLQARNLYLINNWNNATYWDKGTAALSSGELYQIKARIDIVKLG